MIDWTKDVQMRTLDDVHWEDVTVLCHPIDGYVWLKRKKYKHPSTWSLIEAEFRNKPAEPKRVKGWVGIYRSANDVYTIAELRTWRRDLPAKVLNTAIGDANLILCFEIDVPEGHGLKERKGNE